MNLPPVNFSVSEDKVPDKWQMQWWHTLFFSHELLSSISQPVYLPPPPPPPPWCELNTDYARLTCTIASLSHWPLARRQNEIALPAQASKRNNTTWVYTPGSVCTILKRFAVVLKNSMATCFVYTIMVLEQPAGLSKKAYFCAGADWLSSSVSHRVRRGPLLPHPTPPHPCPLKWTVFARLTSIITYTSKPLYLPPPPTTRWSEQSSYRLTCTSTFFSQNV